MRDLPALVHRVAVEAAAKLIEEAALGHALKGEQGHVPCLAVPVVRALVQQEGEGRRVGKLRGLADAAMGGVEMLRQFVQYLLDGVASRALAGCGGLQSCQCRAHGVILFADGLALFAPGAVDRFEYLTEGR